MKNHSLGHRHRYDRHHRFWSALLGPGSFGRRDFSGFLVAAVILGLLLTLAVLIGSWVKFHLSPTTFGPSTCAGRQMALFSDRQHATNLYAAALCDS